MTLIELGFSDFVEDSSKSFSDTARVLGRVVTSHRGGCVVRTEAAELAAVPRRILRGTEPGPPTVGDWVVLEPPADETSPATIEAILERRTRLSRTVAGARSAEQVVAANVDVVFLVMGLDGDFNLRRIERLVTMAWSSGAQPVVVLTKADVASDLAAETEAVAACAPGVPVHAVSSLEGTGLDALRGHLLPRQTVALVGSSGVGKSTLINTLAGRDTLATGAVRASDDRGRHTTTHRELVQLPSGALIIDNPGIRELQLWADAAVAESIGRTFEDIETLAETCRFRDCTHRGEPGCAVEAGIRSGDLPAERLESQRALEREVRYQALRQDDAARRAEDRQLGAYYKRVQAAKKRR